MSDNIIVSRCCQSTLVEWYRSASPGHSGSRSEDCLDDRTLPWRKTDEKWNSWLRVNTVFAQGLPLFMNIQPNHTKLQLCRTDCDIFFITFAPANRYVHFCIRNRWDCCLGAAMATNPKANVCGCRYSAMWSNPDRSRSRTLSCPSANRLNGETIELEPIHWCTMRNEMLRNWNQKKKTISTILIIQSSRRSGCALAFLFFTSNCGRSSSHDPVHVRVLVLASIHYDRCSSHPSRGRAALDSAPAVVRVATAKWTTSLLRMTNLWTLAQFGIFQTKITLNSEQFRQLSFRTRQAFKKRKTENGKRNNWEWKITYVFALDKGFVVSFPIDFRRNLHILTLRIYIHIYR